MLVIIHKLALCWKSRSNQGVGVGDDHEKDQDQDQDHADEKAINEGKHSEDTLSSVNCSHI
jgi:hypothetical protein